jgi:hypothetical protein
MGHPGAFQWHHRAMRLDGEVVDDGTLGTVTLHLTRAEATELRDALDDLVGRFDRSETSAWHAHVPSSDFKTEINVVAE